MTAARRAMKQRQVRPKKHRPRRLAPGKAPKHSPVPEDARSLQARLYLDRLLTLYWSDGTATRSGMAK